MAAGAPPTAPQASNARTQPFCWIGRLEEPVPSGRPLRVILWWRTGFFSARSRRIVLNRILSHPWKINPSGAFSRPFRGFLTGSEWLSPVRCSGGDVHRRRYLTPWTCPRKIRSHDVERLLFPLRFYNEARYPQGRTGRVFHDTHCAGAPKRSRRPGIVPGKLTAGRGGRARPSPPQRQYAKYSYIIIYLCLSAPDLSVFSTFGAKIVCVFIF